MRGSDSSWRRDWPQPGAMEVLSSLRNDEHHHLFPSEKLHQITYFLCPGAPTNIYIQGLDTVTQLSNEIRVLKEENLGLKSRLQASTGAISESQLKFSSEIYMFTHLVSLSPSDTCEEVMQLREAVLTARARLKQAELEAEQWKEELRRLQTHSQEQGQQIHTLRQERQAIQERTNRLVCS